MGMGTVRSYFLSSLVESWSPDELSVLPGNRVEMNFEVTQFIHLPSSLSQLQTWRHIFRKAVLLSVFLFVCLFLAVLGLYCSAWLLIATASLVAEHGL